MRSSDRDDRAHARRDATEAMKVRVEGALEAVLKGDPYLTGPCGNSSGGARAQTPPACRSRSPTSIRGLYIGAARRRFGVQLGFSGSAVSDDALRARGECALDRLSVTLVIFE